MQLQNGMFTRVSDGNRLAICWLNPIELIYWGAFEKP